MHNYSNCQFYKFYVYINIYYIFLFSLNSSIINLKLCYLRKFCLINLYFSLHLFHQVIVSIANFIMNRTLDKNCTHSENMILLLLYGSITFNIDSKSNWLSSGKILFIRVSRSINSSSFIIPSTSKSTFLNR